MLERFSGHGGQGDLIFFSEAPPKAKAPHQEKAALEKCTLFSVHLSSEKCWARVFFEPPFRSWGKTAHSVFAACNALKLKASGVR